MTRRDSLGSGSNQLDCENVASRTYFRVTWFRKLAELREARILMAEESTPRTWMSLMREVTVPVGSSSASGGVAGGGSGIEVNTPRT